MSDYYIYSILSFEYDPLFEPETLPIHVEACELRYNQELPTDTEELIFDDGQWESESFREKFEKFISQNIVPQRVLLQKKIRLFPLNN